MPERLLTIDLGNSSCKLGVWEAGHPPRRAAAHALDTRAGLAEALAAWVAARRLRFDRALVASVASPELDDEVVHAVAPACDGPVECPPPHGVENACDDPHTVGLDRLFAARGAFAILARPLVVADAGTALTVDAVERAEGGGARFLGGAIAPGPALLAAALARGAARLPDVDARALAGSPALGRTTRQAIAAGVAVGFVGAARELVERVAREAGLADAPLVLTGGARGFLTDPALFGPRPVRVEPELVHLGLLAAAGLPVVEAAGGAARTRR